MTALRPCIIDGEAGDCGRLPDGLCVCQNIRTVGHRGLGVDRHLEVLGIAAREVLGLRLSISPQTLASQIEQLLSGNGYPSDGLSFVAVRQYLTGQLAIVANELSPYRQRRMRMIFPKAAIVDYELPFSEHRTSLSESAVQMALADVRRLSPYIKAVLRRNSFGHIISADGAPLFIVENGGIIAPPPVVPSAEFDAAAEAIQKAGLPLATDTVDTDRLLQAEELFFADHRGITAVAECEGHIYIHLTAARIGDLY